MTVTPQRLDALDYLLNRVGMFGRRGGRTLILPRKPLFVLRPMPKASIAAGIGLSLRTHTDNPVEAAVRLDRIYYDGRGKLLGRRMADSHRLDNEHVLTAFPATQRRVDLHEIGRFFGAKFVLLRLQRALGVGEVYLDDALSFWSESEEKRICRWGQAANETSFNIADIVDPAHLAHLFERARSEQNLTRGFEIVAAYQSLRGARTGQRGLAAIQFSASLAGNQFVPRLVWPDGKVHLAKNHQPFKLDVFDFASNGLPDSLTDFQLAAIYQARGLLAGGSISHIDIVDGANVGPRIMLALTMAHQYGLRVRLPAQLVREDRPVALTSWCRFDRLSKFLTACRYQDLLIR